MKKVAILQSNYIPWKGYFDLINMVDEFIIYDDMQYTKRDWRNRNKIKTPNGLMWLTIPVEVKGKFFQKINETEISDTKWANNHWQTIKQFYSKTPYFNQYKEIFESAFAEVSSENLLSNVNVALIKLINSILGIATKISLSSDFKLEDGKTERLLSLVKAVNGTEYLSGPAAKGYLEEKLFADESIKVSWMDYSNYPEYIQQFPPFEHSVTVLDLIFNEGPNATKFMKSLNYDE